MVTLRLPFLILLCLYSTISGKKMDNIMRKRSWTDQLSVKESEWGLNSADRNEVNYFLEQVNYAIYGVPIAISLAFICIYAYAYFAIYTPKWILTSLVNFPFPSLSKRNDFMDILSGVLSALNDSDWTDSSHKKDDEQISYVYPKQTYHTNQIVFPRKTSRRTNKYNSQLLGRIRSS